MITEAFFMGVFATTLMTAFLYLSAALLRKRLRVIHILGTMLTNQTTAVRGLSKKFSAVVAGTIAHYFVGIFFAFVYALLCRKGIAAYDPVHCLIYGIIIGVFAVVVWRSFIRLHPNPPAIPVKLYLLFILLSHLVFALALWWCHLCLKR